MAEMQLLEHLWYLREVEVMNQKHFLQQL